MFLKRQIFTSHEPFMQIVGNYQGNYQGSYCLSFMYMSFTVQQCIPLYFLGTTNNAY
jgi:hypothetical protein